MCRFLFYLGSPVVLGDLITKPKNSLIHQSFESEEREEPLNGDGFGLAWYVPELSPVPGLFRSLTPAWSNRNLFHIADVTRSHCVLAHVRAASEGSTVSEANCHPFNYKEFSFMHNGDVGGFKALRRALLAKLSDASFQIIEGSSDSEFLFGYFLDCYRAVPSHVEAEEKLAQALARCINDIASFTRREIPDSMSYFNIAVSDGEHAAVSRFTNDVPDNAESLHIHTGKTYHCSGGVCRMEDPTDGHGAVIVSSEKLSDDPGWETIPVNHMVVVRNDRTVLMRPC